MIDLPTHLVVGDTPYWGLSFGQLLLAFGGFFLGFLLWHALPVTWPFLTHAVLCGLPLVVGAALALVRPAGRTLVVWFGIVRHYVRTPKVTLWRAA